MTIDTAGEALITFEEAMPMFPQKPSLQTVRRWARSGVHGIVLESTRLGGERGTSKEAVQRFLQKLNEVE